MSHESVSKPLWYVTLSSFPSVTVMVELYRDEEVYFDYSGWPEELIAAGVMQPEWIMPTGKHLRDPDGGKVSVSRRWRLITPEAPPRRYCVVKRERPLSDLPRWPGALEALEAYRKHQAWRWPPVEPAKQPRPPLRLVVDNTRKSSLRIVGAEQEGNV